MNKVYSGNFKNIRLISIKSLCAKSNFLTTKDINKAYNNFLKTLIEVVNNIVPLRTARLKNTSNERFDQGIGSKWTGKITKKQKMRLKD